MVASSDLLMGGTRPCGGRAKVVVETASPMMLSYSLRATQPARLGINDHTGRGRELEALHLERRRAAVGGSVFFLQDKNPQRTTDEGWSRMYVGVFLYGGLASLFEFPRVLDGEQWLLGSCRSQRGTAEEVSSFRRCLAYGSGILATAAMC